MRITRRTVLGASAAGAVSALALSACSKQGTGTGGAGGSGASDDGGAIDASKNQVNAKERSELGEGGVLRLTNNAFPANWNVMHTDGNEENTINIMEAVSPGMYSLNLYTPEGEIVLNESFAKRIELVSEDPQVMEIELNEGMKWSDGTPIDYKSIANTFNTLNGSNEEFQVASSEGFNKVEKVEPGANDLTAKITFKEKYADYKGLAAVMPDALAASPDAFNTSFVDGPMITAGPYKIENIDATNKTVSIVPDENWWGEKALFKQVIWTTIEEPDAVATAYQAGQLDSVEASVPAVYEPLKDSVGNGTSLLKAAAPSWTHITLNGAEGRPLADVKVRQAVALAISREDCFLSVNKAMPYPKDRKDQNNHILMTTQKGYKDNAGKFAKQDPDAAKKLLEEAGYTIEGEQAMKDGKQLEVTYVYNDGSKTNEAVVAVVEENLKAVGIKLNVQKVPPTDLFSKYVIPGQFDLTLFGWNGNPFLSSGDAIWKSDGEQNFGKVGDPEVDKLVDAAAVELDEAKRIDLINQYDAKLWELAGTIPLWQAYDFYVQTDDLANLGANGMANIADWTKIGYVKGSKKLEG